MKKAFTTHGLLLMDKDIAIIISKSSEIIEIQVPEETFLVSSEKIYINPDFLNHKIIEIQIGWFSNNIDPDDIGDACSYFSVDVHINENEDTICEVKDLNFKLEHLSMELQKRIHDKAEEMYQDWLKVKQD